MGSIKSFFNQNRFQVIIGICIVIFIIFIIQFFNRSKQNSEQNISDKENVISAQKNYNNESKSIISDKIVSETYRNTFGKLIDDFFTYCKDGKYQNAYLLLSHDCRENMYPSEQFFEENYCKVKFEGNKMYNFQSWTSNGAYVYLVKIFDNILSSANINSDYIQEYVSIVEENGEYKLNINNYVGRINLDRQKNEEKVSINVKDVEIYMDYQIYNIEITNNTNNKILIDRNKYKKSLYMQEVNGNKIEAVLYDKVESDLIVDVGETKTYKIKFYDSYREGMRLDKLVFSDIVENYDEYLNQKEAYNKIIKIEIDINQ